MVPVTDGFGVPVPKGHASAAMAFACAVEFPNILARRRRARMQRAD